jgi:hypothetical protein
LRAYAGDYTRLGTTILLASRVEVAEQLQLGNILDDFCRTPDSRAAIRRSLDTRAAEVVFLDDDLGTYFWIVFDRTLAPSEDVLENGPSDAVRPMAYHQAAHAVAHWALLQEILVLPIVVPPSKEANSTEHTPLGRGRLRDRLRDLTWSARRHMLECYVIATMAGAMAEERGTGHSRSAAADHDAHLVAELITLLSSSEPEQAAYKASEKRLIVRTEKLIAEYWPQIDAVARAVLKRGTLNEHEFREVLNKV